MGYNGWRNYETWRVATWLDGDDAAYSDIRAAACQALATAEQGHKYLEPEEHACRLLAKSIREYVESAEPIAAVIGAGSVASDLLSVALAAVDWEEVAEEFVVRVP